MEVGDLEELSKYSKVINTLFLKHRNGYLNSLPIKHLIQVLKAWGNKYFEVCKLVMTKLIHMIFFLPKFDWYILYEYTFNYEIQFCGDNDCI